MLMTRHSMLTWRLQSGRYVTDWPCRIQNNHRNFPPVPETKQRQCRRSTFESETFRAVAASCHLEADVRVSSVRPRILHEFLSLPPKNTLFQLATCSTSSCPGELRNNLSPTAHFPNSAIAGARESRQRKSTGCPPEFGRRHGRAGSRRGKRQNDVLCTDRNIHLPALENLSKEFGPR